MKRKLFKYKYTRRTFSKDGSFCTEEHTRESDFSLKAFEGEVADWHRQGQMMKHRDTLSEIQGYDYFITKEQGEFNERAYKVRVLVST